MGPTDLRIVHGDAGGVSTLLRAALPSIPLVNQLPGIRRSGEFTGLAFKRPAVTIERPHVTAYDEVCAFPVKDTVPLTYPRCTWRSSPTPPSRSRRSVPST